jgi:hypothetical protein
MRLNFCKNKKEEEEIYLYDWGAAIRSTQY